MSLVETLKKMFRGNGEATGYHCRNCGEVFEAFTDLESVSCPVCGRNHTQAITPEE